MKKLAVFFTLIISIIALTSLNTYAAKLDNLSISQNKTTIKPGEQVTLTVNFGTNLGSYTFDFAYDKNKLEFVSVDGGETNDNGSRVRVYYFDSTGGSSPRKNMTITFKAKANLTATSTSEIKVTAEGLANADATTQYDDITTATTKSITIQAEATSNQTEQNNNNSNKTSTTNTTQNSKTSKTIPSKLPRTGINVYAIGLSLIFFLMLTYVYISKKGKKSK